MPFIRSIGRWTMTALVINTIIGSGIFGLPSELSRLLGRASPIAFLVAAVGMAAIMLCMAEVASQFAEPGGPYLYLRTAFGRFAGTQVAWFHLLAMIGTGAANIALFMAYLGGVLPTAAQGWQRVVILSFVVVVPLAANYIGVRSGANFTSFLAIAKLLPLLLLISLGTLRFNHHFDLLKRSDITSSSPAAWLMAMLLLVFTLGGFEDAMIPAGEVKRPRQTVPFALLIGLLSCTVVYTLVQLVTVATIGTTITDRPLAQTASMLISGGSMIVTVAAMISTYGTYSSCILNCPRLVCSLASQGDFPSFLRKLHPRFNTPARAIVQYGVVVWLLAISGTFIWAVVLASGSSVLIYAGTCAALIRLRKQNPSADALRMPFGTVLAVIGFVIALSLLSQLQIRQALLMGVTALIATVNWLWAKRRPTEQQLLEAAIMADSRR